MKTSRNKTENKCLISLKYSGILDFFFYQRKKKSLFDLILHQVPNSEMATGKGKGNGGDTMERGNGRKGERQ